MQVKTQIRAGITGQQILRGTRNAAVNVAHTVGAGAEKLGCGVRVWWQNPQHRAALNKAFWFPLKPPWS
ncbi:MAG: hypothetical protein JW953_17055 [Anaerolineae bacterium]|nr:hypothetical protein [Anaerolineae bacterium]